MFFLDGKLEAVILREDLFADGRWCVMGRVMGGRWIEAGVEWEEAAEDSGFPIDKSAVDVKGEEFVGGRVEGHF